MSQPLSITSLSDPRARATVALLLTLTLLPLPGGAQSTVIRVDASTTFAPLLNEVARDYQATHPGYTIAVESIGSFAAANAVGERSADVAFVDSSPPAGAPVLTQRIFAIPLAIVVSPQAGVTAFTRAQVAGVFRGGFTTWKQLGGADLPVRAFTRPAMSAMSHAFEQAFGELPQAGEALVGSAEIVNAVHATPGGVGFTTLAAARAADLPIATIDGRSVTGAIGSAAYPFYALGYLVTSGPPPPLLSRFLAFVETRRPLMAKYGIVSIRDLVP